MQQNRNVLKSWFERGDTPSAQQFSDFIDSIFNFVEDGALLSGIDFYNANKVYITGSIVIQGDGLYIANQDDVTGVFDLNKWNPLPGNSARYLPYSPIWTSGIVYSVGNFTTRLGNVYKCIQNNTSSTINLPGNTAFWSLMLIFDKNVQTWSSGCWIKDDVVFYKRNFYKLVDNIIHSTDLPTELTTGKWKFVSQPAAWSTSTTFILDEFVWVGTIFYRCTINHTSGVSFATDLTAGRWTPYNIVLPTTSDLSSNIISNTGPWIFTLAPAPNNIFGFYVNGILQSASTDYTQTGTNNQILTWSSTDFSLEIGDKVIVIYQ